jgi:ribosomal-protein-alanine N-acetyltransferase
VELYSAPRNAGAVSIEVTKEFVGPRDDTHVEAAWALKERIREADGVLRQREGFFTRAYRRARVHLLFAGDDLVGFAAVRRDGYILFLAVAPEYRGDGFGRRLVAEVLDGNGTVTCHARTSNEGALGFYETLGFEVVRRIDNYYEDGGDAVYLRLTNEEGSLREKLAELLGRT